MISNRVTALLGVRYPIVQAPMGWIARSALASAVCNAGGMGMIETSSGELDIIRIEIARMRDLTDKPFGVNIAQAFVRDPGIVNFVVDQGVGFVSTSAGDPGKYCAALKQAGLTVFHVVPTLKAALRAVEAGVDGLIVEGGEGGGFKHPDPVMTMVLLPQVAEQVSIPIICAGGIACGRTMAAAFAMGAEGVQIGTRMVSAEESPVHRNWKQAIVDADATDTVLLNQFSKPALRALTTDRTRRLQRERGPDYQGPPIFAELSRIRELYFDGDMEASIALTGQVAGRINDVRPVAEILDGIMREFTATISGMFSQYSAEDLPK
jgi:enoyl-[acyl-carrier protein] reductase II